MGWIELSDGERIKIFKSSRVIDYTFTATKPSFLWGLIGIESEHNTLVLRNENQKESIYEDIVDFKLRQVEIEDKTIIDYD